VADWVFAVERAYANGETVASGARDPRTLAAAGAVASRYLAVGTPRSFAIVGDGAISLDAHRTWFAPRDLRCTDDKVAAAVGGRVVSLAEALAADIVCIHTPLALAAAQLRRGTHVNALAAVELDADLRKLATVVDDRGLASIAAGLVDGRQLDELTVFLAQ
jgi:ornithine cyclodeaminase/alanine dehydrogenase-like protein (mu-crystallin family)